MMRWLMAAAVLGAAGLALAAAPGIIALAGPAPAVLTPSEAAAMAPATMDVSFGTARGVMKGRFSGPLLWTVLTGAHEISAKTAARVSVVVTGADGYVAVIAGGEIAPFLAGRPVIVATSQDGKALAPGHWRIVVPGDAHGARDVFDVVKIGVVIATGG